LHIIVGGDHFINVYAPVLYKERGVFFKKLGKYIERISPINLTLGGDFNWAGADIDRVGGQNRDDKSLNNIMEIILNQHKMIDIYRRSNMLRREFTYIYGRDMGSRIDTFFGTTLGTNIYTRVGISDFQISDHKLIYLEINLNIRKKWEGLMEDQ
jgi:hypothetical protein